MAKVKAGIVGIGRMGEYHVGVLSEMQEVDIVLGAIFIERGTNLMVSVIGVHAMM